MTYLTDIKENKQTRREAELAIVSALCYFDIFNYPLTKNQLFEYSSISFTSHDFDSIISNLISKKIIKKVQEYYLLFSSDSGNILSRIENEKKAILVKNKVAKYSNIISKFPFVKAIAISGSYSKGVLDKKGDIDYFIITKTSRLWLCRTLLVMFKKVILLNSRKYFCVNYFIDENELLVPDKNIFVAVEIKSLLPVFNYEQFQKFQNANSWTTEFLPNKKYASSDWSISKNNAFKAFAEKLLNGKLGSKLDEYFFHFTLKHWKKKFPHFNTDDFDLNLRTRKTVSKHHPQGSQNKVLKLHTEKLNQLGYQLADSTK